MIAVYSIVKDLRLSLIAAYFSASLFASLQFRTIASVFALLDRNASSWSLKQHHSLTSQARFSYETSNFIGQSSDHINGKAHTVASAVLQNEQQTANWLLAAANPMVIS